MLANASSELLLACLLHENEHVRNIGQGEARYRKYKRLTLGGGQVTKLPLLHKLNKLGIALRSLD
jgi:hypothetical protein